MLKKEITYVDFNGDVQTETHYFHLNRMEATKFEAQHGGDLQAYAERVKEAAENGSANLGAENFQFIEDLILTAYGQRTEDGRGFKKVVNGVRLADEFAESLAFAQLFEELLFVEGAALEFGNGMVAQPNVSGAQQPTQPTQPTLTVAPKPATPTAEELLAQIQSDPVLAAKLIEDSKK